jgi:TolB-like protein/Flp pilus assembly protein TadD
MPEIAFMNRVKIEANGPTRPAGVVNSSVLSFLVREAIRRHLFRVGFVYCAVSWIIIQVATSFFPALHLPDWSVSLVAALVIIGFPVAMVLAWAYDLTPAGVQRTPGMGLPVRSVQDTGSDSEQLHSDSVPARTDTPAPVKPKPGSLAVLPFVDRSPSGDYRFLGDGTAEELISGLARLDGLRVASRTSSFAFRSEALDVRDIGRRLGVAFVVEGSVHVTEDRLRMTVQLVDVADGYAIWSATLARRIDDLFSLQEELARSILDALRQRLDPAEAAAIPPCSEERLLQTTTSSLSAYTLYLRGRARWNDRTPAAVRRAVEHFRRATVLDPDFAHAWAGLADSYAILIEYGLLAPQEGLPAARFAASRALELGGKLAEAHTSVALVEQLEWNWEGAEAEFRRAIELNPAYTVARQRFALLLAWLGRVEESRQQLERAAELDPVSPIIAIAQSWIEYYAGNPERVIILARETLDEHTGFVQARLPLALALVATNRAGEAVMEIERMMSDAGDTSPLIALHAYALGRAGDESSAERVIETLRERATTEYVSPYYLAVALLGSSASPAVIAELNRAVRERSPQLAYLGADPVFDPVRSDASFERILEQTRLTRAMRLSG